MTEDASSLSQKKDRKIAYVMGIAAAILFFGLALLEPSIRGPKSWVIFLCASFAVWISALKLRNLIHGTGWVFPRTTSALLIALAVEAWLYLWFSH
ncbi:MAG TPA: hypothetical protein VGL82_10535 [Bryobacteraceae bacterium]|jgi:hypothetical protein